VTHSNGSCHGAPPLALIYMLLLYHRIAAMLKWESCSENTFSAGWRVETWYANSKL